MKKKSIAVLLTTLLLVGINPISASAEWRSNSHGWWYSEGNSWATGWREIGDSWYYFDKDGYMASNIIIDGYIIGIDGAWVENDQNVNATFPTDKINIKDYKITIFYEKGTGEIFKCVDGVKTYSELGSAANQEELVKKYGIVVINKDVEVQYGYENYKVVNGQVVYKYDK